MNTRPLNNQEQFSSLLASIAMHFLIREIDKLKHTSFYRHKLKLTAKAFLKELEDNQQENVWKESPEGSDLNEAAKQMEGLCDMLGNLMKVLLSMPEEMHQSQLELFWQGMTKEFKRFNIPLRITQSGELEAIEVSK